MPPLHRIEVINAGAKKNEYIYTYNEPEMRRTVARLEKGGKKIKQPMQRYKGVGEMNADQLADTTMDPRHRTLRRVTMRDLEAAERTFELLMGNEVTPGRVHHRVLPPRSTERIDVGTRGLGPPVALRGLNCPQGGKPHAV